jgi:hypothetical protein
VALVKPLHYIKFLSNKKGINKKQNLINFCRFRNRLKKHEKTPMYIEYSSLYFTDY